MIHSSLFHSGHNGPTSPHHKPTADLTLARNISQSIHDTFVSLDEEFIEKIAIPEGRFDGSTALVAGIYYNRDIDDHQKADPSSSTSHSEFQLVVANLGDCRAILIHPSNAIERLPSHESTTSNYNYLPPADSAQSTASPLLTPLTVDHKPHLLSERSFIESQAGGFITTDRYGLSRVQGQLAVSRAIGDAPLKPYVRNTPDVKIIPLEDTVHPAQTIDGQYRLAASSPSSASCAFESGTLLSDEITIPLSTSSCSSSFSSFPSSPFISPRPSDVLLIASDGFWDVFTNEEAAEAVIYYLSQQSSNQPNPNENEPKTDFGTESTQQPSPTSSLPILSSLASHLAKEAYLRGSMDNITIMAIDIECMKRWLRERWKAKR